MATPLLHTWVQFEDNAKDDEAWQALVPAKTDPPHERQRPTPQHFLTYELLLAFLVVSSVVGYLLWQQTEVRWQALEQELHELRGTLSAIQVQIMVVEEPEMETNFDYTAATKKLVSSQTPMPCQLSATSC